MSNEKALMQEAWRAGYQSPDGLLIKCATKAEAVRTRFTLYGAVKHFRNGKGEPDQALADAINNCAILLTPEGVLIQRKLAGEVAKGLLAQLGREPKTVDQYNAEASMERIMQRVNAPAEADASPKVTPLAASYGARNN